MFSFLKNTFKGLMPVQKTEPSTLIGYGRTIKSLDKMQPIYLPDKFRTGHVWVFGSTRCGKTRLEQNMAISDIRKGLSVAIIDPKGDGELFSAIVEAAAQSNRMDDLIFINPIFPEHSATINPLSHHMMIEELVGHITSGVTVGKEPYFFNVAYELSLAIVMAMNLIAKDQRRPLDFNLCDTMNKISQDEIAKLQSEINLIDGPEARQLSAIIQKILDSPPDYFSKVSSTLRVALVELSTGNIGKIIGTTGENRFIKRLEEGKSVIMVVQLGALLTRKAAYTTGKVVISMIQALSGRFFANNRKITPALSVYIDEAQSVIYPGFEELLAKAGGAGVYVHGFCQSVSQIHAALGKDAGNAVLDNSNTKIFMRVPDPETSKYVVGHFGTHKVYSPIMQVSGSTEPSFREMEEEVLKIEDIIYMEPREFYMMTYGASWEGRTADVEEPMLEVRYPEITSTVVAEEGEHA